MWRVVLCLVVLQACTSAPVPSVGRAVDADALRSCATITPKCPGLPALTAQIPNSCNDAVCFLVLRQAGGREILAAMPLPGGDICGFRGMFGTQSTAILGRWWMQSDGTRQYSKAVFPKNPVELSGINSVETFVAACQAL